MDLMDLEVPWGHVLVSFCIFSLMMMIFGVNTHGVNLTETTMSLQLIPTHRGRVHCLYIYVCPSLHEVVVQEVTKLVPVLMSLY